MFGVLQCKHLWCICRKLVINYVYVWECEFCHVLQFASVQQIHQIPIYNCEVHLLVHHCPWLSRCNVQFVRQLLHCSGKVDSWSCLFSFLRPSDLVTDRAIWRCHPVYTVYRVTAEMEIWWCLHLSPAPYHHVSHTRNCWGDGILENVLLRVTELLPRSAPHRQLSICLNFHNLSASTRPHHSLVNYTLDTLLLHIYNNNESIRPTYSRLETFLWPRVNWLLLPINEN